MEAILSALLPLWFIFALIVFLGIGQWILGPVDRAAKDRNDLARLTVADFLCLFLAVQVPLAFVYQIRGEETEAAFWVLSVVTWLVAPFVWFTCARILSRAGVTSAAHRIGFLGVVLPIVYYGLLPFVAMAGMGVLLLVSEGLPEFFRWWRLVVAWLGLAIGLVSSGLYTRWMIRHVNDEKAAEADRDALAAE